jgi:SAM-dependent methyltransferase
VGNPRGARRTTGIRLAGYSFLILFIELALIRYVAAYVRVFGFFVNFVVIAAFLGMGVGLLRSAAATRLRWVAPPALLVLLGLVKLFSGFAVRTDFQTEALWSIAPHLPHEIGVVPVVLILFAACAILFVPLGASMGREFGRFRPLQAYTIDVAGSLGGIIAFGVLALLHTSPVTWFVVALTVWVVVASMGDRRSRGFVAVMAATAIPAIVLVRLTATPGERWSPYYRITTKPVVMTTDPHPSPSAPRGIAVYVNGALHQYMVDLDVPGTVRDAYLRPYTHVARVDTALVIGAGTGNDVTLLLRLGARYIDAVEIDPTIYALGKVEHFQHPYNDPRVHIHIDDARAFLRRTSQHYDVITMGTLDSQTLLSGMSSVRLDNYVYTIESLRSAQQHLKPDGSLIAYHMSPRPDIAAKVYQLTANAFRQLPRAAWGNDGLFDLALVAGAGARGITLDSVPRPLMQDVALPTDDWPYLYLRQPTIPAHYVLALAGVVLTAWLLLAVTTRATGGPSRRRAMLGRPDAREVALFAMGVGFLLLETKSVTEMSLLFGSTWMVNLLVFASILTLIGVANLMAGRLGDEVIPGLFVMLFTALGVAYVVPAHSLLWLPPAAQWGIGAMLVGLPIAFAAVAFAVMFRAQRQAARGLAFNLLGAIVGGVLEYAVMLTGIKSLYLIAAVAYLGALVALRRTAKAQASAPDARLETSAAA